MDTDRDNTISTTSSNAKSRQSTPKSLTGGKSKSSGKIMENTFNDKVVILARAAKDYMRMCVAYGDVFPPTDAAGCATFVWDVIKQSSQSTPVLREALREAAASEHIKRNLITFVHFYSKPGLFAKYFFLL
jgi:hypothetical protein